MFKTTVNVNGMMCNMCEKHVNDAITAAINPVEVKSSHSKKTTEIITNDTPDEAAITKAITDTGFEVISLTTEPYEKKKILGIF